MWGKKIAGPTHQSYFFYYHGRKKIEEGSLAESSNLFSTLYRQGMRGALMVHDREGHTVTVVRPVS
jgi:hypothetical protein